MYDDLTAKRAELCTMLFVLNPTGLYDLSAWLVDHADLRRGGQSPRGPWFIGFAPKPFYATLDEFQDRDEPALLALPVVGGLSSRSAVVAELARHVASMGRDHVKQVWTAVEEAGWGSWRNYLDCHDIVALAEARGEEVLGVFSS